MTVPGIGDLPGGARGAIGRLLQTGIALSGRYFCLRMDWPVNPIGNATS
jgi:hypothetical protein